MKKSQIIVAVLLVAVSGCTLSQNSHNQNEMYEKAAALRRLSLAVEAVTYEEGSMNLKNADLLEFATQHEPRLLDGFNDYVLKAEIRNGHSILLMCDKTEKNALIEDTGCTGKVDVNHWTKQTLPPCRFTIKIEDICTQ